MPTLAVILPVRNEAAGLGRTLASLAAQSAPPERLLVVDGGSTDDTVALARNAGAETLLRPGGGRGGQITAGIAVAQEDIILIAHGDMVFPPTALAQVRAFLIRNPHCPGGCLGHLFDSARWRYRLLEWWDRRRAQRGDSYGDQAQFFRRTILERCGGFPDQPIMEDVELTRRLHTCGALAYLDLPVLVSPRRFEKRGFLCTAWENWRYRRTYRRHGRAVCQQIHARYYV